MAFWCVETFKHQATIAIDYDIRITNVPENVIFTSEVPKSITATVTGKGLLLLDQLWGDSHRPVIDIDYGSLMVQHGKVYITFDNWRSVFADRLGNDVTLNSVSPSPIELYLSTGEQKRVKVQFASAVKTGRDYKLYDVRIAPDVVAVYAPQMLLDSIDVALTERKTYNLSDTTMVRVAIAPVRGVKFVPDSVEVQLCVDLITNKTVSVPVTVINKPDDVRLRLFPAMVDVTCQVSSTLFNSITAEEFTLEIDYNDITPTADKLSIQIKKQPEGISSVRLNPSRVEYIIER